MRMLDAAANFSPAIGFGDANGPAEVVRNSVNKSADVTGRCDRRTLG